MKHNTNLNKLKVSTRKRVTQRGKPYHEGGHMIE